MIKLTTIAILAAISLTLHAGSTIPLDGKMTIYYEDGSKRAHMEYKDGQPIGIWTGWHKNGKIRAQTVFEDGRIIDIEGRYPNENNSVRFKGVAFHHSKINYTEDGSVVKFPMWSFLQESYKENGEVDADTPHRAVFIGDPNTGVKYWFPLGSDSYPGETIEDIDLYVK
jgi:antitoxin component YwqK of YwqJK toxin-antitoxin module